MRRVNSKVVGKVCHVGRPEYPCLLNNRTGDCVVYCLRNRINGKMYVGHTSRSVFDRWGKDGKEYKGQGSIGYEISKHGWHNFDKQILVDGLDKKTAVEVEEFTMVFLKSRGYELCNSTNLRLKWFSYCPKLYW